MTLSHVDKKQVLESGTLYMTVGITLTISNNFVCIPRQVSTCSECLENSSSNGVFAQIVEGLCTNLENDFPIIRKAASYEELKKNGAAALREHRRIRKFKAYSLFQQVPERKHMQH